jgi:UDP-glucuronate 4-epimerase
MSEGILITGAAGFIGSSLADTLLKTGYKVMGIDNFDPYYDKAIKERNISLAMGNKNFTFREGDIRDPDFLEKCFISFNPGTIVHLAAKAGVRPSLRDPKGFYDVNLNGTLNILELMVSNGIKRMIFASSSSVYGNNRKVPFSETDNVDSPISPYAASKKAGELLCHTYHHLYDLDIFCLRFFTVYGPRQRPDLAIHKFTEGIFKGVPLDIYGDGTSSRDYTHIDDIIVGICGAMNKLSGFDTFNLGESNTITLMELVKILEKYSGRKAMLNYLPMQDGDVLQTFADIRKAKNKLQYNPAVDIETGLRNFVEWFKTSNNGMIKTDI